MHGFVRTALVASMLVFSQGGHAQEAAAAAAKCEIADLDGFWLTTFQRGGKGEFCTLFVDAGRVQTPPCSIEGGILGDQLSGKLKINKSCRVSGNLKPALMGSKLKVRVRLVGGKELMTGVLIDDQQNFFAVTMTKWED
jgi:hypothetical protein